MYIITRKDIYKVANKVHFCEDSLYDALELRDALNEKTPGDWIVAEVFDERSWYGKVLLWLYSKARNA